MLTNSITNNKISFSLKESTRAQSPRDPKVKVKMAESRQEEQVAANPNSVRRLKPRCFRKRRTTGEIEVVLKGVVAAMLGSRLLRLFSNLLLITIKSSYRSVNET